MAGQLPAPRQFPDWIKGMLALKADRSYGDYAADWVNGAGMLLRHGTTTVVDIEAVPKLLPEVWSATPLRVCSCLELTGVRSGRDPKSLVDESVQVIQSLPRGRCWSGLSPHAPYSTRPELLRLSAEISRSRSWVLTTHVAESESEFEMFTLASGPMYDWLQWTGRDMSDCGKCSPVAYLAELGVLSSRLLAAHVNHLAPGDARLLSDGGVTVVHCPRSHAYFGHAPFPYKSLVREGVRVALGTDSLASIRCSSDHPVQLDLFAEMRAFAERHPGVDPSEILAMVTRHGAEALDLSQSLGRLGNGSRADLVVLALQPRRTELQEAILAHHEGVLGVMIEGVWAREPDHRAN
jgi:cytosine/adenosine deaminase-related metal-dependent hydrolase